jgi:hypothetical protein
MSQKDTEQSFSKSGSHKCEKQGIHPTGSQKSKKRRMPLVAFGFVLVFASLCVLSLVGPQTLVSAARAYLSSTSSLDATPTSLASCLEAECYGNPRPANDLTGPYVTTCNNLSETFVGSGNLDGPLQFQNTDPNITTTMCANPEDFFWGNLDITCVYNDPSNFTQELTSFNSDQSSALGGRTFGPWWVAANPNANSNQNLTPLAQQPHIPPSESFYNQNTCVDGHQCQSDDASGLDTTSGSSGNLDPMNPADKTAGDDVICNNDACTNISSNGAYTGSNDGNVCGSGIPYNKLACIWIGANWYYNPTAYNPDGALEEGIADGSAVGILADTISSQIWQNQDQSQLYGLTYDPGYTTYEGAQILLNTGDTPHCTTPAGGGAEGTWTCNTGDHVVLAMTLGGSNFPETTLFQGNPEAISSSFGTTYPTPNKWSYPPTWSVMCDITGDNGQFPCSDTGGDPGSGIQGTPNAGVIKTDWLSGNPGIATQQNGDSGHIAITYNDDTLDSPDVQKIFGYTLTLGYMLIVPSIILIGYQLLWASWTLGRADAMESFGRVILSILAIGVCWALCDMLIQLTDLVNTALVTWHQELGYPQASIGGQNYPYTLSADTDPESFRGIVVPVSRWGCIANDFVQILSSKLQADITSYLFPAFGGLIGFFDKLSDAKDFATHIGEFAMLILSINLFAQVLMRIILINYYILLSPIAFACWGLPGGAGHKVVSQWLKGFISVLSIQAVQLFVLTTLPWVIPALPPLPNDSSYNIINTLLAQVPPLVVLMMTIRVPKLLGTGATKAIGQAGTMTAGAVTALAGAAYNVV